MRISAILAESLDPFERAQLNDYFASPADAEMERLAALRLVELENETGKWRLTLLGSQVVQTLAIEARRTSTKREK